MWNKEEQSRVFFERERRRIEGKWERESEENGVTREGMMREQSNLVEALHFPYPFSLICQLKRKARVCDMCLKSCYGSSSNMVLWKGRFQRKSQRGGKRDENLPVPFPFITSTQTLHPRPSVVKNNMAVPFSPYLIHVTLSQQTTKLWHILINPRERPLPPHQSLIPLRLPFSPLLQLSL